MEFATAPKKTPQGERYSRHARVTSRPPAKKQGPKPACHVPHPTACGELRLPDAGKDRDPGRMGPRARDLGASPSWTSATAGGITLSFNMERDQALCEQARELGREFDGAGHRHGA